MAKRYFVEVGCNHCGGEPLDFPTEEFTRKREAEAYAKAAQKRGYSTEIEKITDTNARWGWIWPAEPPNEA